MHMGYGGGRNKLLASSGGESPACRLPGCVRCPTCIAGLRCLYVPQETCPVCQTSPLFSASSRCKRFHFHKSEIDQASGLGEQKDSRPAAGGFFFYPSYQCSVSYANGRLTDILSNKQCEGYPSLCRRRRYAACLLASRCACLRIILFYHYLSIYPNNKYKHQMQKET